MLEIWGRSSSLNVRKVMWAAQEVGVPFERIDAGWNYGIVDTPEYRRMNPNGLVPTLIDRGGLDRDAQSPQAGAPDADNGAFLLWESNAIVRYLAAKYSLGGLYPEPLRARFDAERWMDWQQTALNPAGRDAFVQLIRTSPERRDKAAIDASIAATEPLHTLLDDHLSRREFMAGERFTMADIPIGVEVHRWFGLPRERPARPHIERWYKTVLARPATEGVLDLELV